MIPVISCDNIRVDSKKFRQMLKQVCQDSVGKNRKIFNSIFTLDFYQTKAVAGNALPAKYKMFMIDALGKQIFDVKTIEANKADEDSTNRKLK